MRRLVKSGYCHSVQAASWRKARDMCRVTGENAIFVEIAFLMYGDGPDCGVWQPEERDGSEGGQVIKICL